MKLHSKIRFFCPLVALFSCMMLMLQAHTLLSAPVIGLLAFLLVQWLYNTTRQPRHPDGSKELEQLTSAQMNDPALAGAAARGGDRGGAFMPTRDIRANDLQRTTVGSWLIVCLTLLGSLVQIADRVDTLTFHTITPFLPYILWIAAGMLMERMDLHQERQGKKLGPIPILLLLLPICFLLFITDLPLISYVVTGEGDADTAQGTFILYPKWDSIAITGIDIGEDPHLCAAPDDPLHFTYDHYGTTQMAVHYRFLGMERTYHFDVTIYPRTVSGKPYAWDRILQTDEFGDRVQGDLMEPPVK